MSYTASGLFQGYWGYTRSPRERVEYGGSKKYKTMEGAQKYIQSKFDQYAPCFGSLSPSIPAEAKELFYVNGQLLQEYSLQPPIPQKEKVTLEDLLNCLEDGDMVVPSEAQPVSGEPAPPVEEKPQAGPPPSIQVQAQAADRGKQEPSLAKTARPAVRKKPLHKKRLVMARQGAGMAYTHITLGWEIEVPAHYYPDKKADRAAELIQLPWEELITMEEASVAQEKAILSEFSEIEAERRKQTAETIAIHKAREYLRVLPVKRTSNQWKVNQFGWNVLSNMVYKMLYRVSENKTPDGILINCTLSWDVHYNTLQHPTPDYIGDGWKIAGQSDRRSATKEELERYLQGGIKAYAYLFTEVFPPIPRGEERRPSINGIPFPGYAAGASLEERVEEMPSFLEDDPAPLEEPLFSGHQDTPREEEPTMAQKLHTTPLNQHRNRESAQKPETARKGSKKPPRRKAAPVW